MNNEDELVALGVVAKPHGIRGALRVAVYNPASHLLAEQEEVWLARGGPPRKVQIVSAQQQNNLLRLEIVGCSSREDADALRGFEVCVPRSALPEPKEGEYYHRDLLGMTVQLEPGLAGTVTDVLDYPSVSCLLVQCPDGVCEIPLLEDYIADVDLVRRFITVRNWDRLDITGRE
ncbi:MAG: 16S rRNA processing protein RimM [Myxococcales bacterium]|nr:16S rRNA processing protein RimM [Myxococcales bacterium]MCB9708645.1 16S rRNA processing protein RimM [Myxococcales bacterium]